MVIWFDLSWWYKRCRCHRMTMTMDINYIYRIDSQLCKIMHRELQSTSRVQIPLSTSFGDTISERPSLVILCKILNRMRQETSWLHLPYWYTTSHDYTTRATHDLTSTNTIEYNLRRHAPEGILRTSISEHFPWISMLSPRRGANIEDPSFGGSL